MKEVKIEFLYSLLSFKLGTNTWYLIQDKESAGFWNSLQDVYTCENRFSFMVGTFKETEAREIWEELVNDYWRQPNIEEFVTYNEMLNSNSVLTYDITNQSVALGSNVVAASIGNSVSVYVPSHQWTFEDEGKLGTKKNDETDYTYFDLPDIVKNVDMLKNEIQELKSKLKQI